MYFLGLITRCKDEFFIKEFCDYYLSQGVDKIFVIDDNSNDKSIYKNIKDNRIKIIYKKNIIQNNYADKFYKEIKSYFKWIIYCDVDEFITTKKNITNTIKDELKTTFKNVDCIKIPWVMMSCNSIEKNQDSILLENTYRWNHNKKHPNKIRKFKKVAKSKKGVPTKYLAGAKNKSEKEKEILETLVSGLPSVSGKFVIFTS